MRRRPDPMYMFDHVAGEARKTTWEDEQRRVLAERDRYRAALELIVTLSDTDGSAAPLLVTAGDIAQGALNG